MVSEFGSIVPFCNDLHLMQKEASLRRGESKLFLSELDIHIIIAVFQVVSW